MKNIMVVVKTDITLNSFYGPLKFKKGRYKLEDLYNEFKFVPKSLVKFLIFNNRNFFSIIEKEIEEKKVAKKVEKPKIEEVIEEIKEEEVKEPKIEEVKKEETEVKKETKSKSKRKSKKSKK